MVLPTSRVLWYCSLHCVDIFKTAWPADGGVLGSCTTVVLPGNVVRRRSTAMEFDPSEQHFCCIVLRDFLGPAGKTLEPCSRVLQRKPVDNAASRCSVPTGSGLELLNNASDCPRSRVEGEERVAGWAR